MPLKYNSLAFASSLKVTKIEEFFEVFQKKFDEIKIRILTFIAGNNVLQNLNDIKNLKIVLLPQ